jgi:hypothetical protein
MKDKENQITTIFDEAASLYDEVRPRYPEVMYDDVVSLSGINSKARILEIGLGCLL